MKRTHVVTFHKCGSNWFRRLFREAANANGANIEVTKPTSAEINTPVDRGADKTVSLHRTDIPDRVLAGAASGEPVLLCIRDPKDVLISQYWSWKNTHVNNTPKILEARDQLNALSLQDGLLYLTTETLLPFCSAIKTWEPQIREGSARLLKYEDLLEDFSGAMQIALEYARIPMLPQALDDMHEKYSFRSVTKREAGVEKTSSHYRKGVAGDWRNYFDEPLVSAFDLVYGDLCAALGYSRPSAVPTTNAG